MGRKKKDTGASISVSEVSEQAERVEMPAELTASGNLDQLKAKLRRKYHLLRLEPLNFDDKEQLLTFVCKILGMSRPILDVVLLDL